MIGNQRDLAPLPVSGSKENLFNHVWASISIHPNLSHRSPHSSSSAVLELPCIIFTYCQRSARCCDLSCQGSIDKLTHSALVDRAGASKGTQRASAPAKSPHPDFRRYHQEMTRVFRYLCRAARACRPLQKRSGHPSSVPAPLEFEALQR